MNSTELSSGVQEVNGNGHDGLDGMAPEGGIWTVIGGVIVLVGGAVLGWLLTWRRGNVEVKKQEAELTADQRDKAAKAEKRKRRDALEEWQEYIGKLEADRERMLSAMKDQQKALESVADREKACREEMIEVRTCLRNYISYTQWLVEAFRAMGKDPGPMPEVPAPRTVHSDSEFLTRTAGHSVKALEDSGRVLPKPPVKPIPLPSDHDPGEDTPMP